MGLRDVGDTLPPGFRFYPSDEELVCHYLYKKIANEEVLRGTLVEIDLHVCEPWQLPDVAKLNSKEWYFFSFRDRKYATGFRTNRATTTGYWKATGKDRVVLDPKTRAVVGMRKTLVFYRNRAPNGIKTGWIMHEFRLENPNVPPKEDWVLCRVFHKSRPGEDINTLISPDNLYDTAAGATSPYLPASPPTNEHVMPCGCQDKNVITSFPHCPTHHQGLNPSTSLGLWAVDPPAGYLHLSHDDMYVPHPASCDDHTEMGQTNYNTKCEDGYEFAFDFHGWNAVPSSLEDMGFDDDNGSVFV